MTIHNFENHIDSVIVARGKQYYKNGRVRKAKETEPGSWAIKVDGSEIYDVTIDFKNDEIEDTYCDCPYDGGGECKHIVAALFEIRDKWKSRTPQTIILETKTSKINSFDEILGKTTLEELRSFIKENINSDVILKNKFMMHFAHHATQPTGKKYYEEFLKNNLKSFKGRNRWLSANDVDKALAPVKNLINDIQKLLDKGLHDDVFSAIQAIYEGLKLYIDSIDDRYDDRYDEYDGEEEAHEIVGVVANAIAILRQMQQNDKVPQKIKHEVFDYAMKLIRNDIYEDDDELASAIYDAVLYGASDDAKEKTVLEYADAELKKAKSSGTNSYGDTYRQEELVKLKLDVLKERGKPEAAHKILVENIHLESFRKQLIAEKIGQNDLVEAKKLINGGIELAIEKNHHRSVDEYRESLLQIAQKENNIRDIRNYAHILMNNRFSEKYYRIIKQTYAAGAEEEAFVKALMNEYTQHKSNDSLRRLFVEEKMWDRLMAFTFTNATIDTLRSVEPFLEKIYPEELLGLWVKSIDKFAERVSDRGAYQELAKHLRHILKYPNSKEKVMVLIKNYKLLHIRRPALQEELNKIKV